MNREKYEKKFRKDHDQKSWDMYERGEHIKKTKETKKELEDLGKIVREIGVGKLADDKGFIDYTYERYHFIGRMDYARGGEGYVQLINYHPKVDKKDRLMRDKEGNLIYKGILAEVIAK